MRTMTHEEYSKLPGLRASDLKELYRSPAHYLAAKSRPPKEPSPALAFGAAAHMAILEPERFAATYVAMDDHEICDTIGGVRPRATKVYKEWVAGFTESAKGKTVLDIATFQRVEELTLAVNFHPIAGKMLAEPGMAECVLEWKHPNSLSTPMKGRLDKLNTGRIIDIKTCQDARPTAFARDVWNYLYHIQAATYVEAVQVLTGQKVPFTIIAVEVEAPYALMVYDLDETAIELGMSEVDRLVWQWEQCARSDIYPAYTEEIRPLSLPSWAAVTDNV